MILEKDCSFSANEKNENVYLNFQKIKGTKIHSKNVYKPISYRWIEIWNKFSRISGLW